MQKLGGYRCGRCGFVMYKKNDCIKCKTPFAEAQKPPNSRKWSLAPASVLFVDTHSPTYTQPTHTTVCSTPGSYSPPPANTNTTTQLLDTSTHMSATTPIYLVAHVGNLKLRATIDTGAAATLCSATCADKLMSEAQSSSSHTQTTQTRLLEDPTSRFTLADRSVVESGGKIVTNVLSHCS